jgi:peptide deformylase
MLEIAQLGQPVLRRVADVVPAEQIPTPEFQTFLGEMMETLAASGGVGLAAPQVFVSLRVFLAMVEPPAEPDGARQVEIFINPRLTVLSQDRAGAWEGCLSFKELLVRVPRYIAVQVDYQNAAGESRSLELQDFPARVVQHEYDHLEGILTIDRAESTLEIIKASEIDAVLGDEDEDEDEDEGE